MNELEQYNMEDIIAYFAEQMVHPRPVQSINHHFTIYIYRTLHNDKKIFYSHADAIASITDYLKKNFRISKVTDSPVVTELLDKVHAEISDTYEEVFKTPEEAEDKCAQN